MQFTTTVTILGLAVGLAIAAPVAAPATDAVSKADADAKVWFGKSVVCAFLRYS